MIYLADALEKKGKNEVALLGAILFDSNLFLTRS